MTVYNGSALPPQLPRPWGMYAYTRASIGPSTHTHTHSTQLHESLGLGVIERHKAELYAPSIQSLMWSAVAEKNSQRSICIIAGGGK